MLLSYFVPGFQVLAQKNCFQKCLLHYQQGNFQNFSLDIYNKVYHHHQTQSLHTFTFMSISHIESLSLFIVCSFLTNKEVCCSKFSLNCLLYSLGLGCQWYKSPGCFCLLDPYIDSQSFLGVLFHFFPLLQEQGNEVDVFSTT